MRQKRDFKNPKKEEHFAGFADKASKRLSL